ncbi:unnamed protein product [Cochlearia groenlandica]
MKIWCDVCDKEEASVFCCADEASLCNVCDRHVHFANKLAGKHLRFSLTCPSFKHSPLCDICSERRGLLFCQEDRAILCRQCDITIHQANEHTKKHNRFLLTGVKFSAASLPNSSFAPSLDPSTTTAAPSVSNDALNSSPSTTSNCDSGSVCTGIISEYLMETLPGWRVEDLLEHPSCDQLNINSLYDPSSQYHHHHHHHHLGFLDQKPLS